MAGCTQPASSSILRACSRVGHRPGFSRGGTLACKVSGRRPRTAWPIFMAGLNSGEGRPSLSAQRTPRSMAGRATLSSTILRPMSTSLPYSTPLGRWFRSCGRSGSGPGAAAWRAWAWRLPAPVSSGRCARAGCRARRRAVGRSGRWQGKSRSARICAGWLRPRRLRACLGIRGRAGFAWCFGKSAIRNRGGRGMRRTDRCAAASGAGVRGRSTAGARSA